MQATSIYEPIQERLDNVSETLRRMAYEKHPFLAQLLDHVFSSPGKRLRPAITLLASNFHEHDESITATMATAVEMLHIATLIHDDTVDDSDLRRGRATISNLWGRNAAVLVGDYIFAASATYVCDTGNIRVIKRFAETIMELSSGELQEMSETYNPEQEMEQYLQRIYNKTASLFTTAGESGAILSGASEEIVKALHDYSYNLGMAFQIVDDILDFEGTEEEFGKPVGNDLAHGIVTLPTLISIQRHEGQHPVRTLFSQPNDEDLLNRTLKLIQEPSVIDEAYSIADDYCSKALNSLMKLPKNESRDSLEEIIGFVAVRRN